MRNVILILLLMLVTSGRAAVTTSPTSSGSGLAVTGGSATNLSVNSLTNSGLLSFAQLATNTASSTTHSLLFAEAGDLKSRSTNGELRYMSAHPATGSRLLSQGGVNFYPSGSRGYSTTTGWAVGTNSVTMRIIFRVPEAGTTWGTAYPMILSSSASGNAGGSLAFYTTAAGAIRFAIFGDTTSDARILSWAGATNYAGKVIELVGVRDSDAGTGALYVNGVLSTATASTAGTPPSWSGTVSNTYVGVAYSSVLHDVYAATVFNYALSASQVLDVARYGIPYADKWGSTNNLIDLTTLNGGFESTNGPVADIFANWLELTAGTSLVTNTLTGVYSGTNALVFSTDGTASKAAAYQTVATTGKRYRYSMAGKIDSGTGTLLVGWQDGTTISMGSWTLGTSYSWISSNDVAIGTSFFLKQSGNVSKQLTVDEVTLTRLGAVVDLDFANPSIEDLIVKDRSTNYFDATLVGGVTRSTDVPSLTAATNVIIGASYLGTDGAEVLAQRNGTAAQEFRLYKTWANAGTDYERFSTKATTTNFLFLAAAGGTGTQRPISFANLGGTVNSYNQVVISTNGLVGIGTNSPTHALHVAGGFKLADGTQSAGYVLTTDANGVGTWQAAGAVTATNAIPFSGGNGTNLTLYPSSTANIALTVRSLTSQNSSMMEFIDSGSTTRHLITTNQLSIKGTVKIVDGTEGAGKVLKSDANGASYWGLVDDTNMLSTADAMIQTITFVIDGGGSAITTGIKGDLEIPYNCTINRVTMLADQSGSIVVDIWKDTYANYPATDADSITASAVPTITAATKSQDGTLTGWTTSVTAGDILRFNVDSASTVTRVTISLKVTKN